MTRAADALAAARSSVGPCEAVADLSWPLQLAAVVEVVTADGRRLIAKAHGGRAQYDVEVDAYRRWVPAIAERAPELVVADDERGVLVVTALDGEVEPVLDRETERRVHRDAGVVLRRFHEAERAVADPDAVERRVQSFRHWTGRAGDGLLDADDMAFAEKWVDRLRLLPAMPAVPTHGDWSPRNWLVDHGVVRVIDFERAGPAWWTKDLERLWWKEWLDRPDLRDAFLDGYGRELSELEATALLGGSVLGQLTTIAWGTEHGDLSFAEHGRATLRAIRAAG